MDVVRRSMRWGWVTAIVAASVALVSGQAVAAQPGTGANITEAQKQEILTQHNLFRAEVGSAPLVWDNAIAQGAQQWADAKQADGKFEHSTNGSRPGLGENLAGGGVKDATIRLATGRGVTPPEDERAVYHANPAPINSTNFSHYTQIVWDKTTKVGCGFAPAGKLGFGMVVCRYGPGGNVGGERPYPEGTVPTTQAGLTALGVAPPVTAGTQPGGTQAAGTQGGGTPAGGTQAGGTQGGGTPGGPQVVSATSTQLPCGSVTRSPDDLGGEVTIDIVNNSAVPVTISWLNREGQKELPVTADPNGTAELTTFADDVWIAEAGGQCLTLLKGAGKITFG